MATKYKILQYDDSNEASILALCMTSWDYGMLGVGTGYQGQGILDGDQNYYNYGICNGGSYYATGIYDGDNVFATGILAANNYYYATGIFDSINRFATGILWGNNYYSAEGIIWSNNYNALTYAYVPIAGALTLPAVGKVDTTNGPYGIGGNGSTPTLNLVNMVAGNIKGGVVIGGVTGNLAAGAGPFDVVSGMA